MDPSKTNTVDIVKNSPFLRTNRNEMKINEMKRVVDERTTDVPSCLSVVKCCFGYLNIFEFKYMK